VKLHIERATSESEKRQLRTLLYIQKEDS
jgi:hypothetical protein